jgi:hypothetical protein
LLFSLAAHAEGGDFFAELLGRESRPALTASYEITQHEATAIGGSPLSLREHSFSAGIPLNSLSDKRWRLQVNGSQEEIGSKARFPNGRPLPNSLWNIGIGASYLKLTEEDRTVGGYLMVGTNSDHIFRNGRDLFFRGTFAYKIPKENESAWIFFLSFANDRSFLNYLPLPGALYFFRPHPKLRLGLGLPFLLLFWSPWEKTVLNLTYFPLYNAEAKLSYFFFGPAHAYFLVKYDSKNFFLSDRSDRKERLFAEETEAKIGVATPLERNVLVNASLGYGFGRKFFLGRSQSKRAEGQILRPANGAFASLRLATTF